MPLGMGGRRRAHNEQSLANKSGQQMTPKTMTRVTSTSCLACAQAHLINPKTGKVLGSEDVRPASVPYRYKCYAFAGSA